MPGEKYMHEFDVASAIDNSHYIIGLLGTANERIPLALVIESVGALGSSVKNQARFVDLSGDNATAALGRIDKPHSTLEDAMDKASIGQTIYVFSCNETTTQLILKDGVNIIFLGGKACNVFGFTDNSVTVGCSISGKFISNYGVILDDAASVVEISDMYFSTTAAIRPIVLSPGATLRISNSTIKALEASSGYGLAYVGDGSVLIVLDCQFKCSSTFQRAIDLNSTGVLKIKDSILESGHTESIISSAANNVYVYGTLTTNKAKNSNITIKVGNLVVDAAAAII